MKMTSSRQRNALEDFFLSENVRFAAALSFPPCSASKVEKALKFMASFAEGDAAVACWLCCGKEGDFAIRSGDKLPQPNFRVVRGAEMKDLHIALNDNLCSAIEDEFSIQMLTLENQEKTDMCVGVILNANHAVCDGKVMISLANHFMRAQDGELEVPETFQVPSTVGHDIGTVLQGSGFSNSTILQLFPKGNDVKHLSSHDVARPSSSNNACTATSIHCEIPSYVMNRARSWAKKQKRSGSTAPTVTGLLLAGFSIGMARSYFRRPGSEGRDECGVSISTLVNMRPFLPEDVVCTQAISTITVGSVHKRSECMQVGNSDHRIRLLQLAEDLTDEMRTRLDNGEAHAQALSMAKGTPPVAPDATLELSNMGMVSIPAESKVILGQRFDKYRGISVLVHSERGTGDFRISVSWGMELNGEVISEVTDTAINVIREIAGESPVSIVLE